MASSELKKKIQRYKESLKVTKSDIELTRVACRSLEERLGVKKIEPKEYRFLQAIALNLELGKRIDLKQLALSVGYTKWQAQKPESNILRAIDDKVFDAIIGVDRKTIHQELRKVISQDEDMGSKMRAIELASKITGMQDSDGTKIQINFPSYEVRYVRPYRASVRYHHHGHQAGQDEALPGLPV